MNAESEAIDWLALADLRDRFLSGVPLEHDYWKSEAELASYDATFAQRIGWKWRYVLRELQSRGWVPPESTVLCDWACGTGIAQRSFLDAFGHSAVLSVQLTDRSALAISFAKRQLRRYHPDVRIGESGEIPEGCLLLLSHVLPELPEGDLAELVAQASKATAILWVEPGTRESSRALSRVRDQLRDSFNVIAPCSHQQSCGILAPGSERHWCHHFAPSPPEIYTSSFWSRFSRLSGVDLSSLPLSFIVLDRRPSPPLPNEISRVIGRPRLYKAWAEVFLCREDGVSDFRLSKRNLPEAFRQAKKEELPPLLEAEFQDREITQLKPWPNDPEHS